MDARLDALILPAQASRRSRRASAPPTSDRATTPSAALRRSAAGRRGRSATRSPVAGPQQAGARRQRLRRPRPQHRRACHRRFRGPCAGGARDDCDVSITRGSRTRRARSCLRRVRAPNRGGRPRWRCDPSIARLRSAGPGSAGRSGGPARTSRPSCRFSRALSSSSACERVELKTDARNARSRRAMEALPAQFEGIHRRHMKVPNGWRDTAWCSVIARSGRARGALRGRLASNGVVGYAPGPSSSS